MSAAETCPLATTAHYTGGRATLTQKPGMVQNHIRSNWVRCGNEPGESELSSITKVAGISGIRTSNPFGDRHLVHLTTRQFFSSARNPDKILRAFIIAHPTTKFTIKLDNGNFYGFLDKGPHQVENNHTQRNVFCKFTRLEQV